MADGDRRRAAPAIAPPPPASSVQPSSHRHRIPDLSVLTGLLAVTGELRGLADRFATAASGRVGSDLRHVTFAAMPHGAKTYLAAALAEATGERLCLVSPAMPRSATASPKSWAPGWTIAGVVTLEPRTALAYERSELVRDESAARVAALAAWRRADGGPRILVASLQALFQRTLGPDDIPTEPLVLRRGSRLPMERVARSLIELGYESVPEVGGRGELARRGGILDVFPAGQPWPVRVEWFGDEIDSLRAFDPADQRGTGPVEEAGLLPASEFLLGADSRALLETRLGRSIARLPEPLAADLERFGSGNLGDAAELWGGYLAPATALDHLGLAIWLLDEPAEIAAVATFLHEQADLRRSELERAGELPARWASAYPSRGPGSRHSPPRARWSSPGSLDEGRPARRQSLRLARARPAAGADRDAARVHPSLAARAPVSSSPRTSPRAWPSTWPTRTSWRRP